MREVILPSGAKLGVAPAPFADAKALYQGILRAVGATSISTSMEMTSVIKDLFCSAFSSKEIDVLLDACMKRCTYDGTKITEETFEPVSARTDYVKVCTEVALENVLPFFKSLLSEFKTAQATMQHIQA